MDGDDAAALREQIAALTAAVSALTAVRIGPKHADVSVNTIAAKYERHVGKQVMYTVRPFLAAFGERMVATLRRAEYAEWRDEDRAKPKTGKPPKVGTLNQGLRQTLAMFRWAVGAELIAENPIDGVAFLKGQRPRETEIDPDEDDAAFVDAPLLVRVFQSVCNETGARNGCEVRMLERSHIDRARGVIRFWRKNTKGKVMTRDVPVTRELIKLIDELPPVFGSPFIFANPATRRPYCREHMMKISRPYLGRLTPAPGDERVTTHDRRHTRVSRLARAGMNPMASMKLIGHKTPAMHWRYLHVSDVDREKMKDILEQERASGVSPTERKSRTL